MPPPARLITLNLGSQTIGLAEFRAAQGGLVLFDYRLRETPLDPETGQRRDAPVALHETAAVLREMMREMQIHHAPVNYAVPSQSVFARFVKLPALQAAKIDKIVAFEAQQNVPFPIDEVVWDYQLVGGGLGEQIQVVIVAIKRDLLDEINNAVEEAGLRTRIVGMASMGLYNAFRYNYPGIEDCSLLLDIGARTTNILFIESGRFFCVAFLSAAARSPRRLRGSSLNHSPQQKLAKNETVSSRLGALTLNLLNQTLRAFRKSHAVP